MDRGKKESFLKLILIRAYRSNILFYFLNFLPHTFFKTWMFRSPVQSVPNFISFVNFPIHFLHPCKGKLSPITSNSNLHNFFLSDSNTITNKKYLLPNFFWVFKTFYNTSSSILIMYLRWLLLICIWPSGCLEKSILSPINWGSWPWLWIWFIIHQIFFEVIWSKTPTWLFIFIL